MPNTLERNRAIVLAHNGGMTLTMIGRAHGLTRSRVQQIVRRAARQKVLAGTPGGELSTRLRNALLTDGCEPAPHQVRIRYTTKTLLRLPNVGAKSRAELNDWLKRYGLEPIECESQSRTG